MQKSPEAFRTISEVATWLDTPAHVLRFWESRFPEIAPVKRAGGRRYYRPADMRLLGGIKHLLHTEGHTIRSVQDRLKAEGIDAIGALAPAALPGASSSQSDPAEPAESAEPRPARPVDGAARRKQAAQYDSEIPPIGFFFDDSEDAAPADVQSGTFRPVPEPEFDATKRGASSQADADTGVAAREPIALPDLPPDPADDDPALRAAPVPVAAALRGLEASVLRPSQRDVLPDLVARLSRLAAAEG